MMRKLNALAVLGLAFFAGTFAYAAQPPKPNRLDLKSVADTPDPFSPALGSCTVTGNFEVKPTGQNVDNKQNKITRLLRMTVVVKDAAGSVVRTLTAEQVIPQGQPAGQNIPAALSVAWDGKNDAGALVADGTYTYEVTGSYLLKHEVENPGKGDPDKETILATTGMLSGTILVDATAPLITDVEPTPSTFTNNNQPTVSAKFADAGSGVDASSAKLLVNGEDKTAEAQVTAAGISWQPAAALTDGDYAVSISVKDLAGNEATASTSFTVDTVDPVVTDLSPENGSYTGDSTPTLSGSWSDERSGIDTASALIKLDGQDVTAQATVTATGFSLVPAALAEGQHTLSAQISDKAGNTASASTSFLVDTTPPAITNLSPPDGSTVADPRPTVSADFADALSGVDAATVVLLVDGEDKTSEATVSTSGLTWTPSEDVEDGEHTVTISVSDNVGNEATASSTFTVLLKPVAVASALPSKGIAPFTVTFDASASYDVDGTIVSYHWNFGDESDPEFGVRVSHEYTEAGEYTAILTVTDDDGYQDELELTITAYLLNDTATVTLQDGLNGYSGTRDSTMYGWPGHGHRNFGALTKIKSGENDRWRPLFRFAVFQSEGGPVPDGAQIVSATMGLYKTSPYNTTWNVYQLKRQFVEMEVGWDRASAAEAWTVGGAGGDGTDRVAEPVANPFIGWDPGWVMVDVTNSLQTMSDGSAVNAGWLLVEPVRGNIRYFATRENADQTIRPKLIISYRMPPQAVIATTPDPAKGFAPLKVTFDGSGSSDPDGTILFHYWYFGDGGFGEGETVEHTYQEAGLYKATLEVTDDQGTVGKAFTWVAVAAPDGAPVCVASATPTKGAPPLGVQFTGTAQDVNGSITSWHWDFGDEQESTEQSPGHTYQQSGRYTAVLTVTDNDGLTAQASVYIEVEQAYTLTFREGDGGEFSDFVDCNLKERYPDYHEERSEYLETQSAAGNVRRCLIRLRDIIGHAQGQIPHDAKIISAKLRLRPGSTTGQQIAVYRITEGWSIPYGSPKWPTRRAGGAAWGSPGCSYTDEDNKSHLQSPEDVLTLTSQPFPYEWDVTEAVRAWSNDADLNQGFVVEAITSGSSFSSSDSRWEHWRPVLLVTLSDLPDIQKPKLAITSSLVSNTKRAFVEGTKDPEVDTITLTADGNAVDVTVTNSTKWFAFVERNGSNTVELVATSTDSTSNTTELSETLVFTPIDADSNTGLVMEAGDSALITVTSSHEDAFSIEVVPGNGGATVAGDLGQTLEVPYASPGEFTATVKVLDSEGSVLETYEVDVTAVKVTMKEGFALGVKQGYRGSGPEPYYEVEVAPASAAELVYLLTENEDLLTVKDRVVTETSVKAKLVLERVTNPRIQARLGGVAARIVGRDTISGFSLDTGPFWGSAKTGVGTAYTKMTPLIPNLRVEIRLGFGATYLDGATVKSFSSSTDYNAETGKLRLDVIVPQGAPDFETRIRVYQTLSDETQVAAFYGNRGIVRVDINPVGGHRHGSAQIQRGIVVPLPTDFQHKLESTHLLIPNDCQIGEFDYRAFAIMKIETDAAIPVDATLAEEDENGGPDGDRRGYPLNLESMKEALKNFPWLLRWAEVILANTLKTYNIPAEEAAARKWWMAPTYTSEGRQGTLRLWSAMDPNADRLGAPVLLLIKQPIEVAQVVPANGNVKEFERFEAEIALDDDYFHHEGTQGKGMTQEDRFDAYDADHDGEKIAVEAIFSLVKESGEVVGGHVYHVPCFPMKETKDGPYKWKVRFSPPEKTADEQHWELTIHAVTWHKAKADVLLKNYDGFNPISIPSDAKKRETYYHYYGYNNLPKELPGLPSDDGNQHQDTDFYNQLDYVTGKPIDKVLPIPRLEFKCDSGDKTGPLVLPSSDLAKKENPRYLYAEQKAAVGQNSFRPFVALGFGRPWVVNTENPNAKWGTEYVNIAKEYFTPLAGGEIDFNLYGQWIVSYETLPVHQLNKERWGADEKVIPPYNPATGQGQWQAWSYYDQARCKRLDDILGLAEKNDVKLLLAIWGHPDMRDGDNIKWGGGNFNAGPHNQSPAGGRGLVGFGKFQVDTAAGGTENARVKDFWKAPSAAAGTKHEQLWGYQKNYYRYLIARYGTSSSLGIWEIISEFDGTGTDDGDKVDSQWLTQGVPWFNKTYAFFKGLDPLKPEAAAASRRPVAASTARLYQPNAPRLAADGNYDLWKGGDIVLNHGYYWIPNGGTGWSIGINNQAHLFAADASLWDLTTTKFGEWNRRLENAKKYLRFNGEFAAGERYGDARTPAPNGIKASWRVHGKKYPTYMHYAIWASLMSGASAIPVEWNDGKEFGEMKARKDRTDRYTPALYPFDNFAEMRALKKFMMQQAPLDFGKLAAVPAASFTLQGANLKGWALKASDSSSCVGWIYNSAGTGNVAGAKVTVKGMDAAATYKVRWFNTWTGGPIGAAWEAVTNQAGTLTFSVKDLTLSTDGAADRFTENNDTDIRFDRNDIAFKVVKQ